MELDNGNFELKQEEVEEVTVMEVRGTNNQVEENPIQLRPSSTGTELSFLVTHWLAHWGDSIAANQDDTMTPEQRQALHQIRRAAIDLSSAFHTLGSFGTTTRVSTE